MKELSPKQLKRAAELLDALVRPGDNDFWRELEEAQVLLGYAVKLRIKRRGRPSRNAARRSLVRHILARPTPPKQLERL